MYSHLLQSRIKDPPLPVVEQDEVLCCITLKGISAQILSAVVRIYISGSLAVTVGCEFNMFSSRSFIFRSSAILLQRVVLTSFLKISSVASATKASIECT